MLERARVCCVGAGLYCVLMNGIRDLHTSWRMGVAGFLSVVGDIYAWLIGDGVSVKEKKNTGIHRMYDYCIKHLLFIILRKSKVFYS